MIEEIDNPPTPKRGQTLNELRELVVDVVQALESDAKSARAARVKHAKTLLYASQVQKTLIHDADTDRRFEELEQEIARLKAGKLAVVK